MKFLPQSLIALFGALLFAIWVGDGLGALVVLFFSLATLVVVTVFGFVAIRGGRRAENFIWLLALWCIPVLGHSLAVATQGLRDQLGRSVALEVTEELFRSYESTGSYPTSIGSVRPLDVRRWFVQYRGETDDFSFTLPDRTGRHSHFTLTNSQPTWVAVPLEVDDD